MNCFDFILCVCSPFLRMATNHPRRWLFLLSCLGTGWLVATSLTAVGMYMVACHVPNGNGQGYNTFNSCNGNWSLAEAHLILIIGSLLNVALLVVMLSLLLHERRGRYIREDPPPDYETLIKSETPPPTYEELDLNGQPIVGAGPSVQLRSTNAGVHSASFSTSISKSTDSTGHDSLSDYPESPSASPPYYSLTPSPVSNPSSLAEAYIEDATLPMQMMSPGGMGIDNPAMVV